METAERGELARLYGELAPRLWRALRAYSGDPALADDALDEAFAQFIHRGAAVESPERWIWRAAFRIAAGELKERRRFVAMPDDAPVDDADPATDLLPALARLPPKQRAALILHYYIGYRTREIAQILGSSRATVRVHLSAGRKRLRRILERDDG
ncbi:MAG TPA: sigma-70 family RNA polymerase sigma factor [Actinomycetota bacterium]|nr:sigma-70 family RNA polymerase sigma factor [Actinomycetota bacterium]